VTQDQSDEGDWTGSRCMNCGHRFDGVMVAHRLHRPEPSYALKSAQQAAPLRLAAATMPNTQPVSHGNGGPSPSVKNEAGVVFTTLSKFTDPHREHHTPSWHEPVKQITTQAAPWRRHTEHVA